MFRRITLIFIPLILIATVHLLLAVQFSQQRNDGYIGATLDDTWIHVRFAYFIAHGEGLAYNPPELTSGATSPLWVLLLAGIYAIFDPAKQGQVEWAIALSGFFQVLTVLAIAGFGWSVTRRAWIGFTAGLLTALTGRLIWMGLSGMETTCFTFFCIVAIWSYTSERRFGWRTGILTALATLARPEGYLLAVIIGLDAFILLPLLTPPSSGVGFVRRMMQGWRGIFAYVILAGSYVIVTFAVSGYLLPNTFRVKNELGRKLPDLPFAYYWTPRADHGWLLIGLGAIGLGYLLWKAYRREITGYLWILWATIFVLAVLFLGHNRYIINHARYVAPAIPFHMLLVAAGIWTISDFAGRWKLTRYLIPVGLTALAAILTLRSIDQGAERVAIDVQQLHDMHVQAAAWVRENTVPGDTIALNDVGAIVHLSDRKVIDVVGLVTPDMIPVTQNSEFMTCRRDLEIAAYLVREKPTLIGIFPTWYWCLTHDWQVLEPVETFKITGKHLLGSDTMVFYKPLWDRWMFLSEIPADATPLNAHFQEGIELAAYKLHQAGNRLMVTMYWHAHDRPTQDYHVFTHLFDASGELIAQQDGQPQQGRIPMSWWQDGFILADSYTLELEDASVLDQAGLYLRVGVYSFESGNRLQRVDEGATVIDAAEFQLQ